MACSVLLYGEKGLGRNDLIQSESAPCNEIKHHLSTRDGGHNQVFLTNNVPTSSEDAMPLMVKKSCLNAVGHHCVEIRGRLIRSRWNRDCGEP